MWTEGSGREAQSRRPRTKQRRGGRQGNKLPSVLTVKVVDSRTGPTAMASIRDRQTCHCGATGHGIECSVVQCSHCAVWVRTAKRGL